MAVESIPRTQKGTPDFIELPAPTAAPIVFAFGVTLIFAGLVTSSFLSALGAIVFIAGAVGWFGQVLPHERIEPARISKEVSAVTTTRSQVEPVGTVGRLKRAWLPVEIYPVSAGIKGGLAGSVAMAALAMLYGIISGHGIWYPVNLLAAGFFPVSTTQTAAEIAAFDLKALLIAIPIHLITSLLVGLLYGATLPMLTHRPILLGGFIGPIVWSGIIHSILGVVNPVLDRRIDWFWFVLSQVGFGVVAGIVVSRQERVRTRQQEDLK